MMTLRQISENLDRNGVSIDLLLSGDLHLSAAIPHELQEAIKARKPDIVAYLAERQYRNLAARARTLAVDADDEALPMRIREEAQAEFSSTLDQIAGIEKYVSLRSDALDAADADFLDFKKHESLYPGRSYSSELSKNGNKRTDRVNVAKRKIRDFLDGFDGEYIRQVVEDSHLWQADEESVRTLAAIGERLRRFAEEIACNSLDAIQDKAWAKNRRGIA